MREAQLSRVLKHDVKNVNKQTNKTWHTTLISATCGNFCSPARGGCLVVWLFGCLHQQKEKNQIEVIMIRILFVLLTY